MPSNPYDQFKDWTADRLRSWLNDGKVKSHPNEEAAKIRLRELESLEQSSSEHRRHVESLQVAREANQLSGEANSISKKANRLSKASFIVALVALVVAVVECCRSHHATSTELFDRPETSVQPLPQPESNAPPLISIPLTNDVPATPLPQPET